MNIQLITNTDETTEDLVNNPSGSSEQENKPSKKKRRIFPLILVIALLLVIGIGIYYIYMANKPKDLKINNFSPSVSIDNTIYTGLINENNTISKVENNQVTEFATLPENYTCDSLLYNENENQFYIIGTKDENNTSEKALFILNEDGSVNQEIFHASTPSSDKLTNKYDDFQYIQGNFYALHFDKSNVDAPYTIVKITPEGNTEDFYPIRNSTTDFICYMIANNNTIYCAFANENEDIELITLENVNGDMQTSESPFGSVFSQFYNCNDDYFTYLSWGIVDEGKKELVQKVMKYSIDDKSSEELLSLKSKEYQIQNVFDDCIYYSQELEGINLNGISSVPVKLFKYNWETKETTDILDKVINPADIGITEKVISSSLSVNGITNTGDKILYQVYLGTDSTTNHIYFICNSDGSDDKLLTNRVTTN